LEIETTPATGEAAPKGTTPETTPAPAPRSPTFDPPTPEDLGPDEGVKAESAEAPAAEEPKDDDKKKNRVPAQERINQAIRRQRMAERERDRALRELDRMKTSSQPAKPLEEMTYDEREEHRIRKVIQERDTEVVRSAAEDAEFEARVASTQRLLSELEMESERFPNVHEEILKINLSPDTADFLANKAKDKAAFAHYLVNNPEVAERLYQNTKGPRANRYTREDALIEMAEINASLRRPQRRPTNVADTGTTLSGGKPPSAQSLVELAEGDDMRAYQERRRRQEARQGQR